MSSRIGYTDYAIGSFPSSVLCLAFCAVFAKGDGTGSKPLENEHQLGLATQEFGLAQHAIERYEGAALAIEQAIEIFDLLAEKRIDFRQYRLDAASARVALANVLIDSDNTGRAIDILSKLVAEDSHLRGDISEGDDARSTLANAYESLARVARLDGSARDEEIHLRRALALREDIAFDKPGSTLFTHALDVTRNSLAAALLDTDVVNVLQRKIWLAESIERLADELERTGSVSRARLARKRVHLVRAETLRDLSRAIEAAPHNAFLHANRRDLYRALNRYVDAVRAASEAIEADPGKWWHWEQRGDILASLGLWEMAIADFRQASEVDIHPSMVPYLFKRAKVHVALNQINEYRTACRALADHWSKPGKHYNASKVSWTCALLPNSIDDPDRVVALAEPAVEKEPRNAKFVRVLGAALYRKGEIERAISRLEESVQLSKWEGDAWHWLLLAMANEKTGRQRNAKELLNAADRWIKAHPALDWVSRLELSLLRREAESTMKGKPLETRGMSPSALQSFDGNEVVEDMTGVRDGVEAILAALPASDEILKRHKRSPDATVARKAVDTGEAIGSWTTTGSLALARDSHSATVLADGTVLICGGRIDISDGVHRFTDTCELYDPKTGQWSETGNLYGPPRYFARTILLPSGQVLMAGGGKTRSERPYTFTFASESELYDPKTGQWSPTGERRPVAIRNMFLLKNGKVFALADDYTAEIYDPISEEWVTGASIHAPLFGEKAIVLRDERILVVGGYGMFPCRIFDPRLESWARAASIGVPRHAHGLSLLSDGRVLAAGGRRHVATSEIYDPELDSWSRSSDMTQGCEGGPSSWFIPLPNGDVLRTGGMADNQPLRTAERFIANQAVWQRTQPMSEAHANHQTVILQSDKVLVISGWSKIDWPDNNAWTPICEIYSPE
jgi:tetratricopeptide (TPR) repeat protein